MMLTGLAGVVTCAGCGLGLFTDEVPRGSCGWCATKGIRHLAEIMELSATIIRTFPLGFYDAGKRFRLVKKFNFQMNRLVYGSPT